METATDDRLTERWYCFEINTGRWHDAYVGKCLATRAEIEETFPYATIEGNLVRVYGPPTKPTKKGNR